MTTKLGPNPTRKRAKSAEYDNGGETTKPEPGWSRPIGTRVEPTRLEAEVYKSQHTVGAGEREKEAKRAQGP